MSTNRRPANKPTPPSASEAEIVQSMTGVDQSAGHASEEASCKVQLLKQQLNHKRWTFWLTLIVIIALYVTVILLLSCGSLLADIKACKEIVAIAIALLTAPTLLLFGLCVAILRPKPKDTRQDCVDSLPWIEYCAKLIKNA